MKTYTPLHCHSHYSLLDGLSKPKAMADRIGSIEANGCGLTDHGSISGAMQFASAMKKAGKKPVLGCELYMCNEVSTMKEDANRKLHHLPILAKNQAGWKTLVKIVGYSNHPDHYYYKPRISPEELASFLDGNIIGFSGHLGSDIAISIMPRNEQTKRNELDPDWRKKTARLAKWYEEIFGKGNFFLEVQMMDKSINKDMGKVGEMVRQIAIDTGIPTLATPDAHYCTHEDAIDQRVLLCCNMKTTMMAGRDPNFMLSGFFHSDNYHIPTFDEMKSYGHTDAELDATNEILDGIGEYEISQPPSLPKFPCPNGADPDEYLRHLCREGWKRKIEGKVNKSRHAEYGARVDAELKVLQGAGLSSYFLIVGDVLKYVRSNGLLPGPGRGSAAGCMVSYLCDITSIDPIRYGLIFERFYNAGRNTSDRISMPDIDVDVPVGFRDKVIDYLKDTYGHDKVGQMITFQTMKGKGAIKDVIRAYGGFSFEEVNQITKHIPDEARIADELQNMEDPSIIRWALENNSKELMEWCHLNDNGDLEGPLAPRFEQAMRLEGTKTNQSKHAAGIVIAPEPLDTICPMVYDGKKGSAQQICGFEMFDAEDAGLLKLDILGVAVLDKVMGTSTVLQGKSLSEN